MKKQKLIESYFLGTLSVEEKDHLNELLKSDTVFNEEFQFYKNLNKVTEAEDDRLFKTQVQQYENELNPNKKTHTKWLVAASIIILLGMSYFIVFQNINSNEALFAENFEPYRNIIQPIVRSNVSDDIKSQAFIAYEKREFNKAILFFSKIQETESNSYYIFYKANCFLALENSSEAISLLKNYISTQGDFTEKARWYLALAYLKENNIKSTKNILQNIVDSKTYYHKKAALLLNELK
jgi:tetratricopeptide (TPR) repeat protein